MKYFQSRVLLFFLILTIAIHCDANIAHINPNENEPIVQTSSGVVIGKIVQGNTNKDVAAFLGIPYAEPPVGENRFLAPRAVKVWTLPVKNTEKSLPCYQFYSKNFKEYSRISNSLIQRPWSENCLTLNIWVPQPTPKEDPVLIFIHSGEFSTGSGTAPVLDGATLAAEANNVIVTVNYRLGPFGFLALGTPEIPGNAGLLDQQLAMNWVKKNIQFFGGNPEAIILVGEGDAGSASVGYHLMSESSEGLFKTVAVIGGSVLCPNAFKTKENSLKLGNQLLKNLGCDKENLTDEIQCLRNAHPEDIVDAERSNGDGVSQHFLPTVDGSFITESPLEAMASGRFLKVKVLSIINSNEGSLRMKIINPDVLTHPELGITLEGFRKAVRRITPNKPQSVLEVVEEMYLDDCTRNDPVKLRDAAFKVYGDVLNDCCLNRYMDYLSMHGSPVFFNVNEIRRASDPSWVGSSHELVIKHILGYPLAVEKDGFSSYDAEISAHFIGWINENARKPLGDPTSSLLLYNLQERPYVYWNLVPHNHSNYRREKCMLWNEIIPQLQNIDKEHCN